MIKNKVITVSIAIFLLIAFSASAYAANPVYRYFTRLFDETRAEIAIGEMMLSQIKAESAGSFVIEKNEELTGTIGKFGRVAGSNTDFDVYIIESDILDEIPLPGGHLILTRGLLNTAKLEEQKNFILARNVMHVVLKHPMQLIKSENLYPDILNELKLKPEKRDKVRLHSIVRDYLRNLAKMDHKRADLQGILLTKSPEKTREAAISLMKSFSSRIWPILPWDTGDMPTRISELEKLKLPE